MKLLFKSIIVMDHILGGIFWIPIEIVWFFIYLWFNIVQWAEEELEDGRLAE